MESMHSATYSPDDNKLRLYPTCRLDPEEYARVKAAGFRWAPKQELFVAPAWTPEREDLLIEMCGEVDDEDKSLVERAEERAERFEDYGSRRRSDAEQAKAAVSALADGIPLGQPILVGHHSEKRARRDAERIENGMRRAVRMWEQSKYWISRAQGAIGAAKYKERPDVRARRIKGLEAERRKQERRQADAEKLLAFWSRENLTQQEALNISNYHDHGGVLLADGTHDWSAWSALESGRATLDEIRSQRLESLPRYLDICRRWLDHYDNRLAYERAMLEEAGGLIAEKIDLQPGGLVRVRNEWMTIIRVNRKDGKPVSVTTNGRYVPVRTIEEIQEYRPPTAETAAKVKAINTLPPLANYPGEGFAHITKAEFMRLPKDYRGTRARVDTAKAGAHRVRVALGCFALPNERDEKRRHSYVEIFLSDIKRVDPPAPPSEPEVEAIEEPALPPPVVEHTPSAAPPADDPQAEEFQALRDRVKAGVRVISAPQLFPTPKAIARKMIEAAKLEAGHSILEPSAGTGALLNAMPPECRPGVTAVEINFALSQSLEALAGTVRCSDFLECSPEQLGQFDRVIMNPPFENAIDIKHIRHALSFLRPGGILVALCANGPRQKVALASLGEREDLPAGSFESQGTGVNVAMVVIRNEAAVDEASAESSRQLSIAF